MSRSATRFGRGPFSNKSPDSTRWRRDNAACENETTISLPISASSSTLLTESSSSSATNLGPANVSQLFDSSPSSSSVAQTTSPALSLSTAASVPVVEGSFEGVYGTVTDAFSLTGVPPTNAAQIASSSGSLVVVVDATTASLAVTSSSFGSATVPVFSGPAETAGATLSLVFSSTFTFSAATVFEGGGTIASVPTAGPSTANSVHSQASDSSPDSASSTGGSAKSSFPSGPSARPTSSSFSLSTTSATSSILSTVSSESPDLKPTPSSSSFTDGSTIFSGPSSTSSFPGVLPGTNTMSPATSPSAAFATSQSLSRTFAHNTGGIIGVAVGATIALLLGFLFAFWVRRKKSQNSRPWISSPLLHDDDGLNDAYSPIGRRHSDGRSPDFVRPLSFQSVDRGLDEMEPNAARIAENAQYDADNEHYDTDTWTIPALTGPLASNSPSLSPEFYTPSAPLAASLTSPTSPLTPPQPVSNPISAKGFMRRLRRGRLSMASRGLLTTLAPVVESGPSSVAEISRPPSSQHSMVPSTLVSRPPPTAPPVSNNYSLPWIHRRRSGGPEMAEAAPTVWAV
ncbi:hypothetical protein MSAN_00937500 [Mycena sanguinolenta]|uniref:Uncharacterized protein n=1 Tax=Mycena sanguinolenta TaxID=230812 RepID=A0A8H7DBK2_9AGAR|nr:hypothetical protein MSAN_00937500 [Mycena sanguinolenta]